MQVNKKGKTALLMALIIGFIASTASAQVTLPDTGVDMDGTIVAAITFIGAIVGTAVGGFAVFVAIRKGLKWIRTALA